MTVIPPFMDRAVFYSGIRPLFGAMSQYQVNGLERLLNVWEQYYAADPVEDLAYDLATSFHETGETMQPIKENLNYTSAALRVTFAKYFTGVEAAEYARQPERIANHAYANRNGNGNEASGDGWRFRGEGDVQNTGRANAKKATDELNKAFNLGIDLVANPDKRGDPIISAHSLFMGNRDGWWTGKRLGDFIKPGVKVDFKGARAVVNGDDDDELIADYAVKFLAALTAAGAKPRSATQPATPRVLESFPRATPVPIADPVPTPTPPAVSAKSIISLVSAFLSLLTRKPT